jgi:hypothetical protein
MTHLESVSESGLSDRCNSKKMGRALPSRSAIEFLFFFIYIGRFSVLVRRAPFSQTF